MSTATAEVVSPNVDSSSFNLFSKGVCVNVTRRSWTARIANRLEDFEIEEGKREASAIASLGMKDLIDPDQCANIFSKIESRARKVLDKSGKRFNAVGATFVPWGVFPTLQAKLTELCDEYGAAADEFAANYVRLRDEWVEKHPALRQYFDEYPKPNDIRHRFSLTWNAVVISSPIDAVKMIEDSSMAITLGREAKNLKSRLVSEAQNFIDEYVSHFRNEVVAFCSSVIDQKGNISSRSIESVRAKIQKFQDMNIFDDTSVLDKLNTLRLKLEGQSSQSLKSNVSLQSSIVEACQSLVQTAKADISGVTGTLKRRVIVS